MTTDSTPPPEGLTDEDSTDEDSTDTTAGLSRRGYLAIASTAVTAGVAGCLSLPGLSPPDESDSDTDSRVAGESPMSQSPIIEGTVTEISPADAHEFNYPYLLFVPEGYRDAAEERGASPLICQPNNTGYASDEFADHRNRAQSDISSQYRQVRALSDDLVIPVLMPIFPRPESDPESWEHYVHALDDTTMGLQSGPLERVDRQLLSMATHANRLLYELGFESDLQDQPHLVLNGFSASGNFCERFTVLHPKNVISVSAGGLNGMVTLPVSEIEGEPTPYPVGISNIDELTGRSGGLQIEALASVSKLFYMGEEDTNDTIPYSDAWSDPEIKGLALSVYGNDMITDRFPTCERIYDRVLGDGSPEFKVYPGVGHTPEPAYSDILSLHGRALVEKMDFDFDFDFNFEEAGGT